MRRLAGTTGLLLLLFAGGACGGTNEGRSAASTTTVAARAATPAGTTPSPGTPAGSTTPSSTKRSGGLADQYGVRYCEMLTVTIGNDDTTAEVWGTQGLNDCPQEVFSAIDAAAVVSQMKVTLALPNGPRYWVLDDIVANEIAGSGETRDFGGVAMRSIALVNLGKGVPDRRPYTGISVKRDTEFRFSAGRTVYELTAPDRSVYIMQSYSLEIDPKISVEALSALGDRLALPEGWTFGARVLDAPLMVEDVNGIATVVQDELRNSYQLRGKAT